MYIKKYWGNFIGGSDDSLNLVAFLEDQKKEEISLSEIFAKIGLDKQNCSSLWKSSARRIRISPTHRRRIRKSRVHMRWRWTMRSAKTRTSSSSAIRTLTVWASASSTMENISC